MSTSGSYDATTTMSTIIRDAFSLVGAIDDDEPISGEMWTYCKRALNKLIAFLSTNKGLWLIEDVSITLTPGTTSYTIGVGETIDNPKPMQIFDARRVQTSTYEIPLEVASRYDYMSLPNKALQADPTMIYYQPGNTTGTLYVWPTGTATANTIKITTQRPIQDFDSEGNNPDLPEEWILAIEYALAVVIAPKYLGGVVPPAIQRTANSLLASLTTFDEEKTSVFVSPK